MKNEQELIQEDLNEIRGLLYDVSNAGINWHNNFALQRKTTKAKEGKE